MIETLYKKENMNLHEVVISEITDKKLRKENGEITGIPFPFPKLQQDISEIAQGDYFLLLSESGQGKSKLSRNMFVYHPLQFSERTGYNVKILYFALEDPKKKVYKNLICHYLYTRQKYSIGLDMLDSKGEYILPKNALELIANDKPFYDKLNKNLFIIDDCLTCTDILRACDDFKRTLNGDEHVIVIVDNYANLLPEKGQSEWDATRAFSRNVVRLKLCKEYNWTVAGILQESADTTKERFRNVAAGKSTAGVLEPNNSTIGDVKVVIRDCYYALGLFNPWKYEVLKYPNHKSYDIDIMRNNIRFVNIFKNNEGITGNRVGLFFDKHECFHEMPSIDKEEELDRIYRGVLEEEKLKKQKYFNQNLFK